MATLRAAFLLLFFVFCASTCIEAYHTDRHLSKKKKAKNSSTATPDGPTTEQKAPKSSSRCDTTVDSEKAPKSSKVPKSASTEKTAKGSKSCDRYPNPYTDECGNAILCTDGDNSEPVCTENPPSSETAYVTKNGDNGACIEPGFATICDGGRELFVEGEEIADGGGEETEDKHDRFLQDGNPPEECFEDEDYYDDDECHVAVTDNAFLAFPGLPVDFDQPTCDEENALRAQILGYLGDQLDDGENVQVLSVGFNEVTVTPVCEGFSPCNNNEVGQTLGIDYQVTFMLHVCFNEEIEVEEGVTLTGDADTLAACGCPRSSRVLAEVKPSAHRQLLGCSSSQYMMCQACGSFDFCYCPCSGGFRRLTETFEKRYEVYENMDTRGLQECCDRDDVICRIQSVTGFEEIESVNCAQVVESLEEHVECTATDLIVSEGENNLDCGLFNDTCTQFNEYPDTELCCGDTEECECGGVEGVCDGTLLCCDEVSCDINPVCQSR